jgi:hypothetical protein
VTCVGQCDALLVEGGKHDIGRHHTWSSDAGSRRAAGSKAARRAPLVASTRNPGAGCAHIGAGCAE